MLLIKEDYSKAIAALRKTAIVSNAPANKIKKEFTGKFSSIGPDTVTMGLIPAIALYESKPATNEDDAGQQRVMLCNAILQLMPENDTYTLLFTYLVDKYETAPERIQFHFDKALTSLKMTIRLFEEK